jgi:hypothetical protein
MRHLHQFLCRFPLWTLGTATTFVGLAIAAAQVWPAAKAWDEAQRDRMLAAVNEPHFWVVTAIVVAAWISAAWHTRPTRKRASEGWTDKSLEGLNRIMGGEPAGRELPPVIESIIRKKQLDQEAMWEAERRQRYDLDRRPRERDTTLSEALGYAIMGEWGRSYQEAILQGGGYSGTGETIARFLAAAREGRVRVWAKRSEAGVFEQVPAAHWQDRRLSLTDIMGGGDLVGDAAPFRQFMVNRAEIEREWPHEG